MHRRSAVNILDGPHQPHELVVEEDGPRLPPELLVQIFKRIDNTELRNCRTVCKLWTDTIDSSVVLMRRITVRVRELRDFIQLQNIPKNVRKIRFDSSWLPYEDQEITELLHLIQSSVETVTLGLGFGDRDHNNEQCLLFRVLTQCKHLVELNVQYARVFIFDNFDTLGIDLTSSTIKKLSIELQYQHVPCICCTLTEDHRPRYCHSIGKLMLLLPQLSHFKLNYNAVHPFWLRLPDTLCAIINDYIVRHNNKLQVE